MLPSKNRLTKRTDFANVYRKGTFFLESPLSLKAVKNNLEHTRIGFSIEKKFFKKAVERNKIKRLLREAFHQNLENIKNSLDIVVFYKRSEPNPDFKIISELVKKLIKKIK
ncbi:MAG: ribonuclease P protein component [Parcubacteria group bacterium]|jgi:ribonuclease P protein component